MDLHSDDSWPGAARKIAQLVLETSTSVLFARIA
jgi:hypothetical protein